MKRAFAVFLVIGIIMTLSAGTALAERAVTASGQCGPTAYWTLYEDGELVINGSGTTDDFTQGDSPWLSYPIKTVTTGDNITGIGNNAFYDCFNLVNVNIPNVVNIGDSTFYYCGSLTSVDMPNATVIGNEAFYVCGSLVSVNMPGTVSIGNGAFYCCENIANVDMPNVTAIGDKAFYGCVDLVGLNLSNITTIGNEAFYACGSLTSVDLVNAATIGAGVFARCPSLEHITVSADNPNYRSEDGVLFDKNKTTLIQYPIGNARASYSAPDSVTSICDYSFYSCYRLTSVNLTNAMTIGAEAFGNCDNLASADMPNVVSIDNGAFYGCDDLTSVNIPCAVSISDSAFSNCGRLTCVDMPGGASIGSYAFYNCGRLTSVNMPTIVSIGNSAFSLCYSLANVVLTNVTSIGDNAFNGCVGLTGVVLPNAASIGNYAFSYCVRLISMRFNGNAPIFGLDAIPDSSALTVYYPINTTGWETPMAVYGNVNWTQWNPLPHIETVTITNIAENGRQIYVEPQNVETGSKIITAFYKNNYLVNSQLRIYEGEPLTLVTYDDIDKIKIMIWDAAQHLKPLAAVKPIDL